jgi:hypothetical protein
MGRPSRQEVAREAVELLRAVTEVGLLKAFGG